MKEKRWKDWMKCCWSCRVDVPLASYFLILLTNLWWVQFTWFSKIIAKIFLQWVWCFHKCHEQTCASLNTHNNLHFTLLQLYFGIELKDLFTPLLPSMKCGFPVVALSILLSKSLASSKQERLITKIRFGYTKIYIWVQ